MGLTSSSGSMKNTPPIQENEKVIGVVKEIANADEVLPQKVEIYNTTHNKTALGETRNASVLNKLKGFIEGSPISVTWFHNIASRGDSNTTFTTLSFLSSSVNTSYLQINNMEVKLREAMQFSYDGDSNISTVTGTCLTYPGFNPNIGDMFVYALEAGVIGLFKISETPERLSIQTRTAHSNTFTLIKVLETAEYQALEERVRSVSYFDKARFLNEDGALLTHQEKIDLDFMNKNIDVLSKHYGTKFYDKSMDSIVRPDGIYDPYMVEYVYKINGPFINKQYIQQLWTGSDSGDFDLWSRSIYSKMLTRDNTADMITNAALTAVAYNSTDSIINCLINRTIILPHEDGAVSYLSDTLLSIDESTITMFDRMVLLWLRYGVVAYESVKELATNVRNSTDIEQFYRIPVIIHILKLLVGALKTGDDIRYVLADVDPYLSIPFTADDVDVDDILSITLSGTVIGILTDQGVPLYPVVDDIVTTNGITDIDLTSMLLENMISSIDNTWTIVTANPFAG